MRHLETVPALARSMSPLAPKVDGGTRQISTPRFRIAREISPCCGQGNIKASNVWIGQKVIWEEKNDVLFNRVSEKKTWGFMRRRILKSGWGVTTRTLPSTSPRSLRSRRPLISRRGLRRSSTVGLQRLTLSKTTHSPLCVQTRDGNGAII